MSQILTVSQLISTYLIPKLGYLQKLKVHDNLGKVTSVTGSQTVFQFSFGNWTQGLSNGFPLFRQVDSTGNHIITPASIDYTNGNVTINSIEQGVDVTASYQFAYYTTTDLTNFYYLAMDQLNNLPPATSFTLDDSVVQMTSANYPVDMEHFLTIQAYTYCIETLLLDLMNPNIRLIFSNLQDFGSFLQSKISDFNTYLNSMKYTIKGRRFIIPRSTSSGRYSLPQQVSDNNWQNYTAVRSGG